MRTSAARASASLYSAMGDLMWRCQRRSRSTLHIMFIFLRLTCLAHMSEQSQLTRMAGSTLHV